MLAGLARRATHFSLLRQRKVSKRKATRSLGPCASLRATCAARQKRGSAQTRLRLKQRAALIPFFPVITGPARTGGGEDKGQEGARRFRYSSLWEKAGMRASGGRKPASLYFTHYEVRLPRAFTGLDSNSQSPHPCLLPEGEGVIPKAPSTVLSLVSVPHPSWLGL